MVHDADIEHAAAPDAAAGRPRGARQDAGREDSGHPPNVPSRRFAPVLGDGKVQRQSFVSRTRRSRGRSEPRGNSRRKTSGRETPGRTNRDGSARRAARAPRARITLRGAADWSSLDERRLSTYPHQRAVDPPAEGGAGPAGRIDRTIDLSSGGTL